MNNNDINLDNAFNPSIKDNQLAIIIRSIISPPDKSLIHDEIEFFTSNDNTTSRTPYTLITQSCTSHCGRIWLEKLFKILITDPNILKNRQDILNTYPLDTLKLLDAPSINELHLAQLLNEETSEHTEIMKIIYFESWYSQWLNTNILGLNIYYFTTIFLVPLYAVLSPLTMIIIPFIVLRAINISGSITFSNYWNLLRTYFMSDSSILKILVNVIQTCDKLICKQSINTVFLIFFYTVKYIIILLNSTIGKLLYFGIIVTMYLYGLYNVYQSSKTYLRVINHIHTKCLNLARIIQLVKPIYHTYGTFNHDMWTLDELHQLKTCLEHPVTQHLHKHPTFHSEPNIFTNKGIILNTYRDFLEHKQIYTILIKYIGFIHGLNTLKTYLVLNQDICHYPIYLHDKSAPVLDIRGMSNPIKSTANDICLDANNNCVMIITGPNGSGKSTYIKTLMTNIILGQTAGFCFAKPGSCWTPFTYLNTYLNIPDCSGKESLFQAEMERCLAQINLMKTLKDHQYGLNIMDELFISTNYLEGVSGAYALVKNMTKYNRCINILTTHFDILTRIKSPKLSKMYFNGTDYIIRQGTNKINGALKMMDNKGFDKTIITDAQRMYQYLQRKCKNKPA